MSLRRVAATRVYIENEEEFHNNHVVELLNHQVVAHYPLVHEQPMTEWLGGTIIVCDSVAYHTSQTLSPSELGAYHSSGHAHVQRL